MFRLARLLGEPIDLTVKGQGINLAVAILCKGGQLPARIFLTKFGMRGDSAIFIAQAPNGAHGEIAININAFQSRELAAAVNVTAGDALPDAMIGKFALSG